VTEEGRGVMRIKKHKDPTIVRRRRAVTVGGHHMLGGGGKTKKVGGKKQQKEGGKRTLKPPECRKGGKRASCTPLLRLERHMKKSIPQLKKGRGVITIRSSGRFSSLEGEFYLEEKMSCRSLDFLQRRRLERYGGYKYGEILFLSYE